MKNYYIERREYNEAVLLERRRVVRRQKISLSIVVLVSTLFLSIFAGARFTFAKPTGGEAARTKVYKSIVIYGGDTLTSISDEYYSSEWKDKSSYMHEVSRINHLDEDEILIAGNYLIVPYYIEDRAE